MEPSLSKSPGKALIVGNASARPQLLAAMQTLGFDCAELDDPYAAAAELFSRPLVYRALVLSLTSLFREELPLVETLKKRLPHIHVWLTHIEGLQATMAAAMRMGADGLLDEDGVLHRMAVTSSQKPAAPPPQPPDEPSMEQTSEPPAGEPVLTAEELSALLAENPATDGA